MLSYLLLCLQEIDVYDNEAAHLFWDRKVNAWATTHGRNLGVGMVTGEMNVPVLLRSDSAVGACQMQRQATAGPVNI